MNYPKQPYSPHNYSIIGIAFILCFINSIGYGQIKENVDLNLKVSIRDSVSNLSIDGVTIKLNGINKYVSNAKGLVKFNISTRPTDTLTVSCVGYYTKKITVNNPMFLSGHIYLKPANSSLTEVYIVGKQIKTINLGTDQPRYNWHRVLHPGQMLAQYIPNTQNLSATILTINYVVNDEVQGIKKPFRVGLYTKSDGAIFPDSILLTDTIIVYNEKRSSTIRVDLSKYKIKLPKNGVIATFEALDTTSANKNEKVWYHNHWEYKSPGIDIDIKKNNSTDRNKDDRKDAYCLILHTDNTAKNGKLIVYEVNKYESYIYSKEVQSSITITIGLDK